VEPTQTPLDVWVENNQGAQCIPFHLHPFTKYRYGAVDIICPIEAIFNDPNWKGRPIPFFIKDLSSCENLHSAGASLKSHLIPYMERAQAILPGYCLNTLSELKPFHLVRDGWSLFIRKRGKVVRLLGALERFNKNDKSRKCFINKNIFFKSIPFFQEKKEIFHRLHVVHGVTPSSDKGHIISLSLRRQLSAFDSKSIAKIVGISESHYRSIEQGNKKPTMTMIIKLAKLYNVSPDLIMKEFNYNIRYSSQDLDHMALASLENTNE